VTYIEKHSQPLKTIYAHYAGLNLTSSPPHQSLKWKDLSRAAHELEPAEFQALGREFRLLHMVSHGDLAEVFHECKADTTRGATFEEFREMLAQTAVYAFGDFPSMKPADCACALIQHMDKQAAALSSAGVKRIVPLVGLRGKRGALTAAWSSETMGVVGGSLLPLQGSQTHW